MYANLVVLQINYHLVVCKEFHAFFLSAVSAHWAHVDQTIPELYESTPGHTHRGGERERGGRRGEREEGGGERERREEGRERGGGEGEREERSTVKADDHESCSSSQTHTPLLWYVEVSQVMETKVVKLFDLLFSHLLLDTLHRFEK